MKYHKRSYLKKNEIRLLVLLFLVSMFQVTQLLQLPPTITQSTTVSGIQGKRVLLITHDASSTGAPNACVQMAKALSELGAHVSLAVQGKSIM